MSASRVKGKEKQGFQCTRVLVRSGRPHIACFAAERGRALRGPLLCVVGLVGGRKDVDDIEGTEQAHSAS